MSLLSSFGTEADGHLQVLWEDSECVFCRGWWLDADGNRSTVLVVLPASEHPAPATLDRLTHEYRLEGRIGRSLGGAAAGAWPGARPAHAGVGGSGWRAARPAARRAPRDGTLPQPRHRHRLGVGQAPPARSHPQGHQTVPHPGGLCRRTDIASPGSASLPACPRERQAPEPPETIAGTLAYMAPEQTGRMNRSIDARSDLYALGVTFYQMLTGTLPFTAGDPMEWVHCHIARRPVPPASRLATVPEALSGARHEAARQDRRGTLPDRDRRRARSAALPGRVASVKAASMPFRWANRTCRTGC